MDNQTSLNFKKSVGAVTVNNYGSVHPENTDAPRNDGINVKFSTAEKEEIRRDSVTYNTGMSTLLYEAWKFYKLFYEHRHSMQRHPELFKDMAASIEKNF